MPQRIFDAFRSFTDPLRSAAAADRWIASLPATDGTALQKQVTDAVSRLPGRSIRPGQVEALLRIDARLERTLVDRTREYTTQYQTATDVEVRLWHAAFDPVKTFIAAYQAALREGHPFTDDKRWRSVLPWVLVRLAYYKGLDSKFRLFRFSHWTPPQWREYHEVYGVARAHGWHRERLASGPLGFMRPVLWIEREYLKTLLLMRLDSGNFTADHVEWVSQQLDEWSATLGLRPEPSVRTGFVVDTIGTQGLRRYSRQDAEGSPLFLDAGPVYARVIERTHALPEKDAASEPGELPVREQRLVLVRLAALFGPDALGITPRAARSPSDTEVRVVMGLPAVCQAIGETREARNSSADEAIEREVREIAKALADPASIASGTAGSPWRMVDASATGCRLTAPVKETSLKPGELLAINNADVWSLGVVRRMQRLEVDELTLGVEIIARRFVRVVLRAWSASENESAGSNQPWFALYVPAHAENRRALKRSLIGPEDRLIRNSLAELETGDSRYLIRFTQFVEQQHGWTWTLFNAVRKLP